MNQGRRMALVKHEMRTMKWFLVVGILCALGFSMQLSMETSNNGGMSEFISNRVCGSWFSDIFVRQLQFGHRCVVILVAVLVVIQYRDLHQMRTEEYMCSLPFTKRERLCTKWLLGCGIIFISWLVMVGGTLLVRQSVIMDIHKIDLLVPFYDKLLANETIWHTLRTLGLFGLGLLAVYSLLVAMHCLVNQGIVASLVGVGVMFAPMELYTVICRAYYVFTGRYLYDVTEPWRRLASHFILGESYAVRGSGEWEALLDMNSDIYVAYDNMWWLFLILSALLLICALVVWKTSVGRDMARNHVLVPGVPARIFLAVGMGLCFGEAFTLLLGMQLTEIVGAGGTFRAGLCFIVQSVIGSGLCTLAAWKFLGISVR